MKSSISRRAMSPLDRESVIQVDARREAGGTVLAHTVQQIGVCSDCMYERYDTMATSRQGPGCCALTCLFVVVLLLPVIGSIILTFMILVDNLNCGEKVLWLLLVWMVPVVGPALYLLVGQRR